MSRKNFMHQADSFLNANGFSNYTNDSVVSQTSVKPVMPISEPEPLPTRPTNNNNLVEQINKPTYTEIDSDSPFKPSEGTVTRPSIQEQTLPIDVLRPIDVEQKRPSTPTLEGRIKDEIGKIENIQNIESERPTTVIPVVVNPNPTAIGLVGSGGVSMGGSSSGGGSEKTILKKSWIPLLLTIGGIAVLVMKPFK